MRFACIGSVIAAAIAVAAASSTAGAEGFSNAEAQAQLANGRIAKCEQGKSGQPLIDCVGATLDGFSSGIDAGGVRKFEPQLVSVARQAADIQSKPKGEAIRVLNRVLAVTRSLAAKDSHNLSRAFNAVQGVFAHAISVIERKG